MHCSFHHEANYIAFSSNFNTFQKLARLINIIYINKIKTTSIMLTPAPTIYYRYCVPPLISVFKSIKKAANECRRKSYYYRFWGWQEEGAETINSQSSSRHTLMSELVELVVRLFYFKKKYLIRATLDSSHALFTTKCDTVCSKEIKISEDYWFDWLTVLRHNSHWMEEQEQQEELRRNDKRSKIC